MVNKIEIDMKQVLLYSKLTVKSGADAGKLVLKRNLYCIIRLNSEDFGGFLQRWMNFYFE